MDLHIILIYITNASLAIIVIDFILVKLCRVRQKIEEKKLIEKINIIIVCI